MATITLNRPDKRNAISQTMLREYQQALPEADDLREVSVIVLQRAGNDFCAGFDLAADAHRTLIDHIFPPQATVLTVAGWIATFD